MSIIDREAIIKEIRRIAVENGGIAPGQGGFQKETGITPAQWRGKLWLKWSDAVIEAGFTPGQMQESYAEHFLLSSLADLTRICGHFPTSSEVKFQRVRDKSFPNHGVFDRLGDKTTRIEKLRAFAKHQTEYADILDIIPESEVLAHEAPGATSNGEEASDGSVYMLKLGRHYKIGKTFDVPRRHRQIDLELPEKAVRVHAIRTDDPDGIESYWHKRFAVKRTNGEWFALDGGDIRAFKRRKFM